MQTDKLLSLKELDRALGACKGTGFKLFKASLSDLIEGQDFILLDSQQDKTMIQAMKTAGRVYPLSRNVVLLKFHTYEHLQNIYKEQSV